jgi:hypothetical protein
MEFRTVHGFSSAIVREDPARGVDGHKFFQQKKTPIFLEKQLGWSMGKEIATTFRHVGT